jgi:hypothetical protein
MQQLRQWKKVQRLFFIYLIKTKVPVTCGLDAISPRLFAITQIHCDITDSRKRTMPKAQAAHSDTLTPPSLHAFPPPSSQFIALNTAPPVLVPMLVDSRSDITLFHENHDKAEGASTVSQVLLLMMTIINLAQECGR